jgi:hypothetical protein
MFNVYSLHWSIKAIEAGIEHGFVHDFIPSDVQHILGAQKHLWKGEKRGKGK